MLEIPLPVAIAALIHDNKILLIKRIKGNYVGYWSLPGGKIEKQEHVSEAAVREIAEELGEESEVMRFLGASENKFHTKNGEVHEINLVFKVVLLSDGGRVSQEDHLEFAWLTRDELRDAVVFPTSLRDAVLAMSTKESPIWASEGF